MADLPDLSGGAALGPRASQAGRRSRRSPWRKQLSGEIEIREGASLNVLGIGLPTVVNVALTIAFIYALGWLLVYTTQGSLLVLTPFALFGIGTLAMLLREIGRGAWGNVLALLIGPSAGGAVAYLIGSGLGLR